MRGASFPLYPALRVYVVPANRSKLCFPCDCINVMTRGGRGGRGLFAYDVINEQPHGNYAKFAMRFSLA